MAHIQGEIKMKIGAVVSVVESEAGLRQSLHALVQSAGWRARTFSSADAFLTQPRSLVPNCLLLDAQLPDIGGLDLQAQMTQRPETPIIFIISGNNVLMTVRALKAGAVEVLTKPLRDDAILSAISDAVTLSAEILGREFEISLLRDRYTSLSLRERQVLALVIQGYLNKQVGGALGISEITVKAHRGRMMRKMAAASLAHLVRMAASLELNCSPMPRLYPKVISNKRYERGDGCARQDFAPNERILQTTLAAQDSQPGRLSSGALGHERQSVYPQP
jgi:FixJ family two-component response regulator